MLSGLDHEDVDRVVSLTAQACLKYGRKADADVNPVEIQTEPLPNYLSLAECK